MTTQPTALRLAEQCETEWPEDCDMDAIAAELRRLHEANKELLEALKEIAYRLESARIWGGMGWDYCPLHPFKYLPLRDKARAAIAKAEGRA